MTDWLLLSSLRQFSDAGLLSLRIFVGAFLIWGVWDNMLSTQQMHEFALFLTRFGFWFPGTLARLSVAVQFSVGVCFIAGALTRWAGLVCAIHFSIALVMVDRFSGLRVAFPATCLLLIGAYLALHGAGRFGVDAIFEAARSRRA